MKKTGYSKLVSKVPQTPMTLEQAVEVAKRNEQNKKWLETEGHKGSRLMMQIELSSKLALDPREVEKPDFALLMHSNKMGCTIGKVRVLNCWDANKVTGSTGGCNTVASNKALTSADEGGVS